jgi:hypothetical protein
MGEFFIPMDGVALAARYSFITNKLRYCGPEHAHYAFLEYLKEPNKKLKEKIKSHITKFEGLYSYLRAIADKNNLDMFDYKVIEAYWLGNKLLDKFNDDDMKDIIMDLTRRGLPESYAKKLIKNIPEGFSPHHSFNVIYVGVGKVTGSVPTNIENINNCLIRTGEIISLSLNTAMIKHRPYIADDKLHNPLERIDEFDYLPEFGLFKPGETVSLHWNFVVGKLNKEQKDNLEKHTSNNVAVLNR